MRILLLTIFLYTGLIASEPFKKYERALQLSYNMAFAQSDSILLSYLGKDDYKSITYYYLVKNSFWQFLGNNTKELEKQFFDYYDSLEVFIEYDEFEFGKDYMYQYIIGDAQFMKAAVLTIRNEILSSFWELKASIDRFERAAELNPEFGEASASLGLISYSLGLLPPLYRFGMSITGISANRKKGFALLRDSYNKATFGKCEAGYNLAIAYKDYLAEYDSAIVILEEISKAYPNNILFRYQIGVNHLKAKRIDEAITVFNDVIHSANKDTFAHTVAFAWYDLGNCYYYGNNIPMALKCFDEFSRTTRSIDFLGDAQLKLAICNDLMPDWDHEFIPEYSNYLMLTGIGNEDIAADKYAMEIGDLLVGKSEPVGFVSMTEAKNYFKGGYYKKLIENFTTPYEPENEFEFGKLQLIASAYRELGEIKTARELCLRVPDESYELEQWILPLKYLTLAKCSFDENFNEQSEEYLRKAEDYLSDGYDQELQAEINYFKRNFLKISVD